MTDGTQTMPRGFLWHNATQFLGALNDNLFKLLIVFSLIARQGPEQADHILALAGVFFALPFLLFSAAAGSLADLVSKRNIVVATKAMEVGIMALGMLAFVVGSAPLLYLVLFLMSTQSALFGPSKYGIVPELVEPQALSRANGLLTAFTYLAIIVGTALAPALSEALRGRYAIASLITFAIATAGLFCSWGVPRTEPSGSRQKPTWFFLRDIVGTLMDIRRDRPLILTVFADAYFLLVAAYVQMNIIPYGMDHLGLSKEDSGYLFLFAALGIGAGALAVGRLSGRNIELGVVPLGAFGLTLTAASLGLCDLGIQGVRGLLFLLGFSAGLFIVPLNAFIQFRAPQRDRGRILAASGFLGWVGVILASGAVFLFTSFELSPSQGFVAISGLTLVLSFGSLRMLPDFLVRFALLSVVRSCYRVKVAGARHVPVQGPALLVANHVSYVDALVISLTMQRRIRFMMFREIYENRWLHPLFKLMGVIPVSFEDSPKQILHSLKLARQAMDDGYLVCIFAEGALTRSGLMRQFKPGLERIVKNSSHPIIPVYLGGLWGSVFSYAYGRVRSRMPRQFPYPVTVAFGDPLPAHTPAHVVRLKVTELSAQYFDSRKASRRSLAERFLRTARMNWDKQAISDSSGKRLSFGRAATGALALEQVLRKHTSGQQYVGVVLPSLAAGALANLAVTFQGKVPVNLNWTASRRAFESAIAQCGIRTIISSRAFVEKLEGFVPPEGTLYLEDLILGISGRDRLVALLRARAQPCWTFRAVRAVKPDDVATVIFSSGSTGTPKGVMLSHHNIQSNIEGFSTMISPSPADNLCAALPLFHSFGFTCTLWLPLISGFSVSYHPNPLDGARIARLARENGSTILIATPTFLMNYIRKAEPEDFKTLRLVVAGAEKLRSRIADQFQEKFGLRPLEGYGATELSPVVSVNVPDVDIDGAIQLGSKPGTVGQAIPGVAVKTVDPDTRQVAEPGEPGLLFVKGPNVMLGYLNDPGRTAEVIEDGWYNTGDIARMDADGFITITDRLSRFSKIGGEMIPHSAVEDVYYQALQRDDRVVAVTCAPDDRKGEKLVVLYTSEAGDTEFLRAAMSAAALPNLWKPGRDEYYLVPRIPLLGSGKMDVLGLRKLAMEAMEPR